MNYSFIRYVLGWLLIIVGILMFLPIIVAFVYDENVILAFVISMILAVCIGFFMRMKQPENRNMKAKEGLIIVALGWIFISVFASFPFMLSGSIEKPIDALFETVSGLTTTGASILTDVEALPKSMLFWRSFTHWIGGMGILVFVLAIVPMTGGGNMSIMKAESPGPKVGKLVPKVQSTAKRLYAMYICMTLLEIVLLLIADMDVFSSICMSFGTAGTGGFGILRDSCNSYTVPQQMIIAVFMIAFGVNFNVYYLIWLRKVKPALLSEELRAYLIIIFSAVLVIFFNLWNAYNHAFTAFKDAFFTVASVITTTGFSTADFDKWPEFSKAVLVTIMFVGACAGSTGGGIKVSRCVIMLKTVAKEVHSYLYPNNIEKIRFEEKVIEHNVLRSINVFIMTYIVVFIFSFLIISIDGYSFTSNFTAVVAAINNIGPGLAEVGPSGNFAHYSILSKSVLILDMLAGRLELFPILMLFIPKVWKKF